MDSTSFPQLAYLVVLFLALAGGVGNGAGHLLLSVTQRGYFPGAATAPLCLLVGITLSLCPALTASLSHGYTVFPQRDCHSSLYASWPSAVRTCLFDARELGVIVWRHVRGSALCYYSSHKWASAVRLSG